MIVGNDINLIVGRTTVVETQLYNVDDAISFNVTPAQKGAISLNFDLYQSWGGEFLYQIDAINSNGVLVESFELDSDETVHIGVDSLILIH